MIWIEERKKFQQVFISNEILNCYRKIMIKNTKSDKITNLKSAYPTWIGSTTPH
jgi:hypothetical protein